MLSLVVTPRQSGSGRRGLELVAQQQITLVGTTSLRSLAGNAPSACLLDAAVAILQNCSGRFLGAPALAWISESAVLGNRLSAISLRRRLQAFAHALCQSTLFQITGIVDVRASIS